MFYGVYLMPTAADIDRPDVLSRYQTYVYGIGLYNWVTLRSFPKHYVPSPSRYQKNPAKCDTTAAPPANVKTIGRWRVLEIKVKKGKPEHLYRALHGTNHSKALRHGSHSF